MAANTTTDSFVQPALYGGLVVGVLSALPIVSAGNLCCCLWVLCGGLVAAFVLQQRRAMPITQGDGALVGLLAGVIGAFVFVVIKIPIDIVAAPMERQIIQRVLDNANYNMPPEFRQYMTSRAGLGAGLVLSFMFMLIVGVIFSTLGGLLGAVFFRKSAPPATDAPPPPT